MNFIRLTGTDGDALFINLDHVTGLGRLDGEDHTWVQTVDGESFAVKDTPESILHHFPAHYPVVTSRK